MILFSTRVRIRRVTRALFDRQQPMPQKKNPDLLEVVRGKRLESWLRNHAANLGEGIALAYTKTCRKRRSRCSTPPTRYGMLPLVTGL